MLQEYTVPRQIIAIVPATAIAQRFCVMFPSTSSPDAHHRQQADEPARCLLHPMARRLPGERVANARRDDLVRFARAQERAERDLPVAAEAGLEPSVRGDPRTVAAIAEVLR